MFKKGTSKKVRPTSEPVYNVTDTSQRGLLLNYYQAQTLRERVCAYKVDCCGNIELVDKKRSSEIVFVCPKGGRR